MDELGNAEDVIVLIQGQLVKRRLVAAGEDVVVVALGRDGPARQTNFIRLLRAR